MEKMTSMLKVSHLSKSSSEMYFLFKGCAELCPADFKAESIPWFEVCELWCNSAEKYHTYRGWDRQNQVTY